MFSFIFLTLVALSSNLQVSCSAGSPQGKMSHLKTSMTRPTSPIYPNIPQGAWGERWILSGSLLQKLCLEACQRPLK